MRIDLNADVGESFGVYSLGDDAALLRSVTSANVAVGFHAGDPTVLRATIRTARDCGVAVGAHPSFPDLTGFGRREMKIAREEMANCIIYQVGALKGFLEAEGMPLNHIKPHGSLYGMAARMEEMAHAVCDAADVFKVPLFGMINTMHQKVYTARGHRFVAEYYTDLDYTAEGGLIITREHAAKDPAEAAARSLRAIREGKTQSIAGTDVAVGAETICVHSDTPNALVIASAVRGAISSYL